MHRNTKLATCCYCGTRAALVLRADRHALACASCGAPISELKSLPIERSARKPAKPTPMPVAAAGSPKPKKKKRRKSRLQRIFEDVFDEIEDIFD